MTTTTDTTADLRWFRTPSGVYVATVPTADPYVSRTWQVFQLGPRKWLIEDVTVTRQAVPGSTALPPSHVDVARIGTAYTLREAKQIANDFHHGLAGKDRS